MIRNGLRGAFTASALVLILGASCTSERMLGELPPADFRGTFTVALRYAENGCAFENWPEGRELTGVEVVITQTSEARPTATATVTGITGGVLALIHGANAYVGEVRGETLDGRIDGRLNRSATGCTYALDGALIATLRGDAITGEVRMYAGEGEGDSCAAYACTTRMFFNGARPPGGGLVDAGDGGDGADATEADAADARPQRDR